MASLLVAVCRPCQSGGEREVRSTKRPKLTDERSTGTRLRGSWSIAPGKASQGSCYAECHTWHSGGRRRNLPTLRGQGRRTLPHPIPRKVGKEKARPERRAGPGSGSFIVTSRAVCRKHLLLRTGTRGRGTEDSRFKPTEKRTPRGG